MMVDPSAEGWMLTEQDVFESIPDDIENFDTWEDLLWPAIGRLAQRKLMANLEKRGLLIHQPDGEGVCDVCEIEEQLKEEVNDG